MSATQKIAVHSLSDLKNTTDDALPNYLHSLKFKQTHTQTDVRLALGYSAVVISGALFYYDWKFGWEASKPYTAPAVVAYFLLNGAFSYWLWLVEKGVVYEGESKTGKVRLSSSTKKHIPIYECDVEFTPAGTSLAQRLHIRAPMTRWFTADGYFIAKPFQQWLASEVPVIGAADPNNVVEEIGRGSSVQSNQNFTVNSDNAADILQQLKNSGANTAIRTTTRASTMTRAQQTISLAMLLTSMYLAVYLEVVTFPQTIQKEIVPVLPFWALVSFGAYLLFKLGYGVFTFNDVPDAYREIQQQIKEARIDLQARGVDVGED